MRSSAFTSTSCGCGSSGSEKKTTKSILGDGSTHHYKRPVMIPSPYRPHRVTSLRPEACRLCTGTWGTAQTRLIDETSFDCRVAATVAMHGTDVGASQRWHACYGCGLTRPRADSARGSMDDSARQARHADLRPTSRTQFRVHGERVRHEPTRCDQQRIG